MKALIEDALPTLADRQDAVQKQLDAFAARYLLEGGFVASPLLGKLLANPISPRQGLVEAFVQALTGGSLQSPAELHRVRAALGIDETDPIAGLITDLRRVFKTRNEIAHEMDLNPKLGRQRRHRRIGEMTAMADQVLGTAAMLVVRVTETTERKSSDETA
jgi:hypothetical protein